MSAIGRGGRNLFALVAAFSPGGRSEPMGLKGFAPQGVAAR